MSHREKAIREETQDNQSDTLVEIEMQYPRHSHLRSRNRCHNANPCLHVECEGSRGILHHLCRLCPPRSIGPHCRDWEHTDPCDYVIHSRVPLSVAVDGDRSAL
ncbi:hypothetical protein BDN71DRAFT_757437 [Pleurotus eryngii]|uniref:Uncharacterized protein n=1 Tax=Pleurotus eryngii TaxID=5323 RepID=A0A9P5ZZV2_PLEER|nr:hypothetical protein BDN71DRAFT_757437 [Pleurotus eryngii]